MRALLDINVLIALFDEDHTHHVETTGWLEENIDHARLRSPRQLTDIYPLALAVENGCRFITFDRSIPISAAKQAHAASLTVI